MPVLEVEVVVGEDEDLPPDLAARLADAAGAALDAPAGATWVRLRPLSRYAESGGGPPPGVRPLFARVLLRAVPGGAARAALVARLTDALAAAAGRPAEHVHVLLEPPAAGRQAFGGRLVEP